VTEPEHEPETPATEAEPRRRPRTAPFIAVAIAVVMAGLFIVLAGSDASTDESADTPLLDQPAPEAVGARADGTAFDLARRKGSWVVLNFFTSTCVPCQQEHPELLRFAEQQTALGADGAELYTIVYDDDHKAVEDFFAANGGHWPVVYDDNGSIAVAFGVSQVPETWIVDPTGVVRGRIITRVTADYLGSQLQRLRELTG
jgi:cytochrome c biogenesis protein CcmG/thiol:disulfide interchange protein DsbE